ncbi:MAG: nucleotide exchange factor GrpE [Pseudomonadota bacterium]|nr:nucleotide exchange factor GrpE [Pseudomonadota bacterium]
MLSRFGRREEVVSLEVARQLHAEREAALAQLERAHQDAAQLRRTLAQREADLRALGQVAQGLESEVVKARAACDELRGRLAAAQATVEGHRQTHAEADARLGDVHRSDPDGTRVQELLADLANLRRRRDIDLAVGQRAERVRLLTRLAEVRDSVTWGLGANPDPTSPWYAGLVAIRDQIDAQLHAEGVSLTGRVGERFDARVHDGVGTIPSAGLPPGVVARVETPGLQLEDGTLVRPARVSVAG